MAVYYVKLTTEEYVRLNNVLESLDSAESEEIARLIAMRVVDSIKFHHDEAMDFGLAAVRHAEIKMQEIRAARKQKKTLQQEAIEAILEACKEREAKLKQASEPTQSTDEQE